MHHVNLSFAAIWRELTDVSAALDLNAQTRRMRAHYPQRFSKMEIARWTIGDWLEGQWNTSQSSATLFWHLKAQ